MVGRRRDLSAASMKQLITPPLFDDGAGDLSGDYLTQMRVCAGGKPLCGSPRGGGQRSMSSTVSVHGPGTMPN